MTKKVVILGGGVAGMSAAQELAERGFHVAVYETRDIPGGKARSIPVPGSASSGKKTATRRAWISLFPRFLSTHYRHDETHSL